MRGLLIFLTMSLAHADDGPVEDASPTHTPWHFSAGLGLGVGPGREINPGEQGLDLNSQLFVGASRDRFAVLAEFDRRSRTATTSGALMIETARQTVAGWARYQIFQTERVGYFGAVGGGVHFDSVRTTFMSDADERHGTRRFVGLGVGVRRIFWSWFVWEIETRVTSTETVRPPGFSTTGRIGLTF